MSDELVLYSRRKRIAQTTSREAAGEVLWSPIFSAAARTRLYQLFENATGGRDAGGVDHAARFAHRLILESEGWTTLTGTNLDEPEDFRHFVDTASDDYLPDVVEAMVWSLAATWDDLSRFGYSIPPATDFVSKVNELLYEHRIRFEFVELHIVPRESQELHEAVVVPTIRLLSSRSGYAAAEHAYQDALRELTQGNARDAITDAGTALQQAFEAAGCEGKALGSLIADARRRGVLAGHDRPLTDAIVKAAEWAAADRNALGDAHNVSEATRDDAWLLVHVIGALILRITGSPRPA